MGNTITKPLTIEEFEQLDLPEDREWELHNGELVGVTLPASSHRRLQKRLMAILDLRFPDAEVLMEYPFHVRERLDLRSADVGVVARERVVADGENRILNGAPDMVIEVLSPSNSSSKLTRYRKFCFESGTAVFWVVDPEDRSVTVYLKGEKFQRVWEPGEEIPITLFGREVTVAVDEIFRGVVAT